MGVKCSKSKPDKSLTKHVRQSTSLTRKAYSGHTKSIHKIILADNDSKYITCSSDKTITIFNATNNKPMRRLIGHSQSVMDIIILENGLLASCSEDNSVRVWNLQKGMLVKSMFSHSDYVNCIVEAKRSILISASYDKTMRIWDIDNKDFISLPLKIVEHERQDMVSNHSLCMIDENTFAVGSYHNINIYKLAYEPEIDATFQRQLAGHSDWVNALKALPDKKILISGSSDKTCKVWNTTSGQCLGLYIGHAEGIWSILVLSDELFVTATQGGKIRVWEMNSPITVKSEQEKENWVFTMAKTKDLKLYTGGSDRVVRVYQDLHL